MDLFLNILPLPLLIFAGCVAFVAGTIKGLVGFAVPTVMISGLSLFLSAELALALLIFPTLITNILQSARQGIGPAVASIKSLRVFLLVGLVFLVTAAQFVTVLSTDILFLLIGCIVAFFAALQLVGWQTNISASSRISAGCSGAIAGTVGGLSGVWGPPTVLYLTAINTPKSEQMRAQGVIYGLGSIALLFAHIQSGVVTKENLPVGLLLVPPAILGMRLGQVWQDRVDQQTFRKFTLAVLVIGGLNLIRRGLMG